MKFQSDEFYRHYIRIIFEDLEEETIYSIKSVDADRLERALEAKNRDFFLFSSLDGYDVAVNLSAVQLINIIWESLEDQPVVEARKTHPEEVRIHFRGKKKAMESSAANPIEWPAIILALESLSLLKDDNFQTYEDGDGEKVIFDASAILYLEIASSLLKEGYNELDNDLKRTQGESTE